MPAAVVDGPPRLPKSCGNVLPSQITARLSFAAFLLNPTTWPKSLICAGPLMLIEASSNGSSPMMLLTIAAPPGPAARLGSAPRQWAGRTDCATPGCGGGDR